jgi:diacylglycerol O-acyltransferase / wax synthase
MRQLTRHDASFLYADTVQANGNVTFVQIYDQSTVPGGKLRFKSILAHVESRLHRSPIFRSRLQRVPLELDPPYWVEDEQFDLEYHVRHIALPAPGDWRQFCIQASRIHARALDLSRPLWEIYVIEGLDSVAELPQGSFALLTKIHHAAVGADRHGEIVDVLHDSSRRPPRHEPPLPWFPERAPSTLSLLSRSAVHTLLAPSRLANPLARLAPKLKAFAADLLRPEHVRATRFNSVVSAHRVFDTRRFTDAEFNRICALVPGATLDDAVLAVCAGGLRAYLEERGELPAADLTAIAPGTDSGGARQRVWLGTALADPVQRLALIHGQTSGAVAPPPAAGRDAPLACCTVTRLPGPPAPQYLCGARMTYLSAILPIADGMGLVFAVTRYDGRVVVSPTSCRELLPDPQAFTQCVRDSFQACLALAAGAPARPARQPPLRSARPRGSAADRQSPKARTDRTAPTPPAAAPAGRRRSTAPRR